MLPDKSVNVGSISVSFVEIENALNKLDVNKGPGPDGLPPKFLKMCHEALVLPLQILFNLSLSSGVFPDTWKHAFVVPVYKNGARNRINNYRPISL